MPPKVEEMKYALEMIDKVHDVYNYILGTEHLGSYDKAVTLYSLEHVSDVLMGVVRGKNICYYEVNEKKGEDKNDEKFT